MFSELDGAQVSRVSHDVISPVFFFLMCKFEDIGSILSW